MKLAILVSFLVLGSLVAKADPKDFYYRQYLQHRMHATVLDSTTTQSGTFDQKLDHSNANDTRTFKQRYWYDTSLAQGPDSPVIFVLCGEAECGGGGEFVGPVHDHAAKIHANMVTLEHRYYGQTQPFDQLTTDNLKYLTTDFALQDAAAFQAFAESQLQLTGKWVVVGGSYPGSLAAYYRLKYPNLVEGALASSGPVQARANFEDYDHHVFQVAGPQCAAQIKKVVAQIEAVLNDPTSLLAIKKQFEADTLTDNTDFLYLVADMGALAVQYGYKTQFCNLLAGSDPMTGYATFTKEIFQSWQMTALSDSVAGAIATDTSLYSSGVGNRQWWYQSCTEFGYFQNAWHDPAESARSQLINPAYHQAACQRLFGFDKAVDTDNINNNFYQPLLDPSTTNILFTNGSDDPWSLLSITVPNGNASNPNTTAYLIDGGSHCTDLLPASSTDSSSLQGARTLFDTLLAKWL